MIKYSRIIMVCLFLCCNAAAQEPVTEMVSRLENNSNHQYVINEVKKILASGMPFDAAGKLAVQTVLVHKYIELQKWDSCLAFCQQQVAEAHNSGNTLSEASFYKLIGNIYYGVPDKGKAQDYWRKAITVAEKNQHGIVLEQCYHNLAAVAIDSSIRWKEAEQYLLRSLQLGKENKQEGTPLYNQHNRLLATLYERIDRLDKAETLYLDVIAKSRQLKDTLRLAESLMFYSDVLTKQKKFDKAIAVSAEAIDVAKKVKMLDLLPTAYNFHAKNLYLAGRFKEAYEFKSSEVYENAKRFNNDLNTKITEAEAKFKNAETEHEKKLAIVKANKEKQVYILAVIGLFSIVALVLYNFYQKKNVRQQLQLQSQIQDEKERLSRDLHDNLGSQMALLSNNIETLDINFRKHQDIEGHIEKTKESSRRLLQTLRETIWILNKEQVTAQEFFDKLVDYAQRYLQSFSAINLQVEENFTGGKTLSSVEALQLFRICQEAITNACKYSGSPLLRLHGTAGNDHFTVVVEDAGRGFDPALVNEAGHYGLKNMQQRATAVKALLKLAAAPGKGTAVTISI
ncbi:MAG: histidine kinase [Ferruginibacter sp.]